MLPFRRKKGKFPPIAALKFEQPETRKNAIFILVAFVELILFILLFNSVKSLGEWLLSIPFVGKLLADVIQAVGPQADFVVFAIGVIVINIIMIYSYSFVKALLKKLLTNKEEEEETVEVEKDDDADQVIFDNDGNLDDTDKQKTIADEHVPVLDHTRKDEKQEENVKTKRKNDKKRYGFFAETFFEGDQYQYAKPSVLRAISILQTFIAIVIAFFVIILALIVIAVLFPVSKELYAFLIDGLKVQDWYVYPFLSLIMLQELCNTFKTELKVEEDEEEKEEVKDQSKEENKIKLRALAAELKKNFDEDHKLRFYPGSNEQDGNGEYEFTDSPYKGALEYIKKTFDANSTSHGRSYLKCIDAMFNDQNVYFYGSFYSTVSEYLIAYAYARLLSGSRLIFFTSNRSKRDVIRKYILSRLTKHTGNTENVSWRVYTSEDRLDQADILIASPEDFKDDNIIENYPGFFEEVCNAIFIDADKLVSLETYLCPVLATRLLEASSGRIRFAFLTHDLLRGFAASSLPKLFCVDKVLSFSSAEDSERVEYTLWNRESSKNRIYYKNGQKLMSLEGIIAEKAYNYGIDGIRVVTSAPIDHGERTILAQHNVEINEFFKEVPEINYMIYNDERCNLASAIYACSRFSGKKNSVAQIISKPYLLREYFIAKTTKENFIKRSSFIQPRITEHAKKERLSLIKIFCKAANSDGMSINDFMEEMKSVIKLSRIRGEAPLCPYCKEEKFADLDKVTLKDFVSYIIAALCDKDNTPVSQSYANKAKDYYILIDHVNHDIYSLTKEKYIVFKKSREVFEKVYSCNERVALRLNDKIIGYLDTFPTRVPLEYVVGQTISYNNVEYEIDQISADCKIIFLRRENVAFKNCLDTVFLRRYNINNLEKIGVDGVLSNSESKVKEIAVTMMKADFVGETYGFYNLMSNNQSLNFVNGVEGNPHFEQSEIDRNKRCISDGRVMRVSLSTTVKCSDGMRLLCSAVFNEFIKTIFPQAYRCIAICPILEKPYDYSKREPSTVVERIQTLYPYITAQSGLVETDENKMQFLFINDCKEDVGVFDWCYDKLASYMHEFLINAYSYLYWLKSRPDLNHYIYFGDNKLCDCFDLEGCCSLFEGYNLVLSDDGRKNYNTAGEYEEEEKLRCSFCHNLMESGRYSFFNEERTMFICADCMDVIGTEELLKETQRKVNKYLTTTYPEITFGFVDVAFVGENEKISGLNEWLFRFDPDNRKLYVGYELPEKNLQIAILCGTIAMWQHDNDLMTEYSNAQLTYEQLKYLRYINRDTSADWILENLDTVRKNNVDEIAEKIQTNTAENGEEGQSSDVYNSFSFMHEVGEQIRNLEEDVEHEDIDGEDYSDLLYDPNRTPRFWKRYFRVNEEDEEKNAEEMMLDDSLDDSEELSSISHLDYIRKIKPNSPRDAEDIDDLGDLDDEDEDFSDLMDDLGDENPEEDLDDGLDDSLDSLLDVEDEEQSEAEDAKDSAAEDKKLAKAEKEKLKAQEKERKKQEKEKRKQEKAQAKKSREKALNKAKGKTEGDRKVPFEPEEEYNPKVRVYNEIVRHAYNYDESPFPRGELSENELADIFYCAKNDYPELFWLDTYKRNAEVISLEFRCKTPSGELDVKQINRKLKELRTGAKYFTNGITKKTDPYKALMTIYKRLILTLDYDGKGLDARIDQDKTKDDRLRSLHSAIVRHKTVCAGYAVAMQYLLQSVGIPCGYVISEVSGNSCHAFNIVKIGKYCYYLDATWGDMSNTKNGSRNNDIISYSYCCVPYSDFVLTKDANRYNHIPNHEMYSWFNKDLKSNRHEYYRYNKAYVSRYNEDDLVRIFAGCASRYDAKEDGRFTVSFKCTGNELAKQLCTMLTTGRNYFRIIEKAKQVVAKNKTAVKLLELPLESYIIDDANVVMLIYKKPAGKK